MKYPTTPKTKVETREKLATIDYSNTKEGYIVVTYRGDPTKKCKVRIGIGGRQQFFTVPSDGTSAVLPLCFGNGQYSVKVYQQIKDTQYIEIMSFDPTVKLVSPLIPWLYPNTYSNYGPGSTCVKTADRLCAGKYSDVERIKRIYNWIIDNLEYDKVLASRISTENMSWWLPDPDSVIRDKKSICWGYSSLFAAMCRSQGIPTKICVGFADKTYHAWNEVYSYEAGEVCGIKIKKNDWTRIDVTYMDTSNGGAVAFVNNNKNYTVEYYG